MAELDPDPRGSVSPAPPDPEGLLRLVAKGDEAA